MIYTNKIMRISLNSLTNIKDYKLLILKRVTAIITKLIAYKSFDISFLEFLLIL